jgi:hypothetical protein
MNSVFRRFFVAVLSLVALGLTSAANPQDNPPAIVSAMLFRNVRIFDGKGTSLSAPSNVVVKANIIERISTDPIAVEPGVIVIAGPLMPGLIDTHWHAMLIRPDTAQAIKSAIDSGVIAGPRIYRAYRSLAGRRQSAGEYQLDRKVIMKDGKIYKSTLAG